MISISQVGKSYDGGATWAVREVSLCISEGELLVLLGESGCGKTTTLKMINRLIDPTAGRIEVDGQDVSGVDPVMLRRRIGYVIQGTGLFPHMTVARNVAIVPQLMGWDRRQIAERVDELLRLVNLPAEQFADRLPASLSGGQRQRVGLARALAARPRIMLMDEPFGALDPVTRTAMQDEYRRIHEQLKLTTVMVTHDMTEALLLADRVAVMYGGRLLRLDTPRNILADPQHDYVRQLFESPRKQAMQLDELLEVV